MCIRNASYNRDASHSHPSSTGGNKGCLNKNVNVIGTSADFFVLQILVLIPKFFAGLNEVLNTGNKSSKMALYGKLLHECCAFYASLCHIDISQSAHIVPYNTHIFRHGIWNYKNLP